MSDPLKLDPSDWKSVAVGGLLAMAGALIVFLANEATKLDLTTNTGIFLSALAAIGLNLARKFLTNTTKT